MPPPAPLPSDRDDFETCRPLDAPQPAVEAPPPQGPAGPPVVGAAASEPSPSTVAPAETPAGTPAVPPADLDPYVTQPFERPKSFDSYATVPPLPGELPFTATVLGGPQVPGYEILGELGRGGMGVVYKARQKGLNRIVALKMILHAEHAGAAMHERFRAEAEAVARLQHPNIVQIHEIGEHDGAPYFSLEFCAGGSLDRKLAGNPLEPHPAAEMLAVLARAVHAAHQAKVIHRDLKPANVLLAEDGTPKVTDFGLAKKLDESGLTHAGAIMGTPSYMAPEQASGAIEEVGPLSDVYALAAMLYELLIGHPPFRGATKWDTLDLVRLQDPVPPSRLNPKVPRDLETICLKGLHKNPARRYGSAAELADDLERFLRNEPIRARRTSLWERGRKWVRRRPMTAMFIAASFVGIVAVLFASTFFNLYQGLKSAEARRQLEAEIEAERKRLEDREKVAGRLNDGRMAADAGEVALARGDKADDHFNEARERLREAKAALEQVPEVDPEGKLRDEILTRQTAVNRRVALLTNVQAFQAVRNKVLFREISPTARDLEANPVELSRLAAAALKGVGVTAEQSPKEVSQALALFQQSKEGGPLAEGCCELLLVWAAAETGKSDGAPADRARRALRLLELAEALRQAHQLPRLRELHRRRARYRALVGNQKGADEDLALLAKLQPRTALDHFLIAVEAWKQGRAQQAAEACEQALLLRGKHVWARYLQALCWLHLPQPRAAEAKEALTGCLDLEPDFIHARLLRAFAYVKLEFPGLAEKEFAAVLRGQDDPQLRYVALVNRTSLRLSQRRFDDALSDLREAVGQARRMKHDGHQALQTMAGIYELREQWGEAVQVLTQVLRRRQDTSCYHARARDYLRLKKVAEARADFEKVIDLEPKDRPSDRLLSDLVELAHLKHEAREYPAALFDCARALQLKPDYPEAYLQRGDTLAALKRYAEAGVAYDRYRGKPRADVYLKRGLIHARLGEYAPALEVLSMSLRLKAGARTHAQTYQERGWVHLQTNSPGLALADFQEALRRGPKTPRALCGKALALVRQRQIDDAVKAVEAALDTKLVKADDPEPPLLAACVYGRAAMIESLAAPPGRRGPRPGAKHQERALNLLLDALGRVPQGEERRKFYQTRVQPEEALASLRGNYRLRQLIQSPGR